jgi:hypothetical protein
MWYYLPQLLFLLGFPLPAYRSKGASIQEKTQETQEATGKGHGRGIPAGAGLSLPILGVVGITTLGIGASLLSWIRHDHALKL